MDNRERLIELRRAKLFEAKVLHEIYTNKEYYGFESFEDLCKAPVGNGGLGLTPKTAMKRIELWEVFSIKLKIGFDRLADIKERNLYLILSVINDENADDLISKAESLTTKDLKIVLSGVEPEECEHEWEDWSKCRKCRQWKRK